jgi:hypothetical protein
MRIVLSSVKASSPLPPTSMLIDIPAQRAEASIANVSSNKWTSGSRLQPRRPAQTGRANPQLPHGRHNRELRK